VKQRKTLKLCAKHFGRPPSTEQKHSIYLIVFQALHLYQYSEQKHSFHLIVFLALHLYRTKKHSFHLIVFLALHLYRTMKKQYGALELGTQPLKYPATTGTKMAKAHALTGNVPLAGPPGKGAAPVGFVAAEGASSGSGVEGAAAAAAAAPSVAVGAPPAGGSAPPAAAAVGEDEDLDDPREGNKGKGKAARQTNAQLMNRLDELIGGGDEAAEREEQPEGSKYKFALALIAQLEARIRDLEAIAFIVATLKDTHVGANQSCKVAALYRTAVRKAPKTHGLGSATSMVFNAFLGGVVHQGVHTGAEAATYHRYLGILLLAAVTKTLPATETELFARHFYAVEAHKEGMIKIVYRLEGNIALPQTPEDVTEIEGAVAEAQRLRKDDPLLPVALKYFTFIDGEPRAPLGVRHFELGKLLRSLLCATGATCLSGKAPPGPLVRKIRPRRGKGKKTTEGSMVDGEDDE